MAHRKIDQNGCYLIHNRGVEQRTLFSSQEDYDRFEAYLYLLNGTDSPRAANAFAREQDASIFSMAKGESLVAIGAYAILPKRFVLLVRALTDEGVARFMQKIQTAYTMYFNNKYARRGRLFESSYRAARALSDAHMKEMFAYTHLSPCELFDMRWQDATREDLMKSAISAMHYRYSSVHEYADGKFVIAQADALPRNFKRVRDIHAHVEMWMRSRGVAHIEE